MLSCRPCSVSEILHPWSIAGMRDRDEKNAGGKRAGGLVQALRLFLVSLIFLIFQMLVPLPQQYSNSSRVECVFFT